MHDTLSKECKYIYGRHTKYSVQILKWNLHIQIGICSHHGEGHVHFHDIPDQGISQETWTFHTDKAGEACCPFHQMLLLEAADEQKKMYLLFVVVK